MQWRRARSTGTSMVKAQSARRQKSVPEPPHYYPSPRPGAGRAGMATSPCTTFTLAPTRAIPSTLASGRHLADATGPVKNTNVPTLEVKLLPAGPSLAVGRKPQKVVQPSPPPDPTRPLFNKVCHLPRLL
ncbi:hypothetical protein JDV02_006700 [Purpureocillium takamizusanense]|uniref:Uncharacterized protein n=1 Tax=Purpureocillium takamizusanense TaxID=2060973 RepID=A0A9Q8VBK9_9HYPO|nr:uncharacterized protein JDV02_006700 [Purpureocillium takamizusanense]UNI20630.1 hypothetical protein JDV02_006700 [Purpureocillium takamizusanense]